MKRTGIQSNMKYKFKVYINTLPVYAASIFRYTILISISFVVLYPFLYMVSIAFRPAIEMLDLTVIWIPRNPTLNTLKTAIDGMNYWKTMPNTIYLSFVGTILQLAVCSVTAYGFARFKFRGSKLMFVLLLFSIIVPVNTILMPLYSQIRFFDFFGIGRMLQPLTGNLIHLNLYNTSFAVILPSIMGNGIKGAIFIYIFRQSFKGLPMDLEEAAYIDGCGFLKTFVVIMAPSASGAFLVVMILSVIWHWNDITFTSMFFPKLETLPIALESINLPSPWDFNDMFVAQRAGALLMIIPVLLLFLVLQKYFIRSIATTGIK